MCTFNNVSVRLLLYLFWLLMVLWNVKSDRKTKVFIGDQNLSHISKFNHLVIDKSRQQIFIGAINGIYQLSLDLELKNSYIDEVCLPSSLNAKSSECPEDNEPSVNSNKILLIYKQELIFCGGVYGGGCQIHNNINVSKVINTVKEPVVPNDPKASTVAFVATCSPSPVYTTNCWGTLYVAATYSNNSESVPAIARRGLNENNYLIILGRRNENLDRIVFDEKYRNKYIINYIYGFSFENFIYFVTTQKSSTSQNSPYISKIVRICEEDDNLYSVYAEIPLECIGADGQPYNLAQSAFLGLISNQLDKSSKVNNQMDALFVTFARSKLPTNDTFTAHGDKSALCVFSLQMINQKFTQNSAECQGKTKTECNVAFITQNEGSTFTRCTTVYAHGPIGGITSISAIPMLTFNILLTAVTAKMIEENTLIVVGTSNGHLKKIIAKTATDAREYADIPIDEGSPVNSDLLFDATGDYLYALTERKLTKIKILDCSPLKTCECKNGKDPLCGWCTSSNSCELKSKCPDRESIPPPAKCIPVTSVTPEELPWRTNENLRLTFEGNLPQNVELLCTFNINGTVSSTEAKRDNHDSSVLECVMSDRSKFSSLMSPYHHTTADLSVKTSNNSVLAETNVKFFNCHAYNSCASCVFSSYPCKWCSENRICTPNVSADCKKSSFVDNLKTPGRHNENDHHQYCPTMNIIANKLGINVPEGTKRNITIKINDIEPFELDPNYECEFSWNSNVSHRKAILLDRKIICDEMEFTYAKNISNITASLAVVWSNSKVFKSTEKVAITIYKCSHMGNACKTCMSLNETYGCGWCKTTRTCEIKSKCDDWQNKNYICPKPSISTFWPQSGPYEGGTNITILGENLDSLDGARDNLKIAGIPCQFHQKSHNFGKEIFCKIAKSNLNKTFTGKVALMINNSSYQSKQNYSFVDPKIESFSPKRGPISGGTVLVFEGQHMNTGSLIEIFIGNLPCKVVANNSNKIECITNSSKEAFEGVVMLKFDGNNRTFKGNSFQYIDTINISPTIQFTPEIGPYEGDTNITIMCKYLDQNFEDIVHSIQVAGVNCQPNNYSYIPGKQVSCRVDRISDGISSLDHHMGPVVLKIDNMSMKSPTNFIFVNPKVHRFHPKRGPISGGTVIFFEGEYMNAGYLTEIFIDSLPCEVIDKHSTQIMCRTKPSRIAFRGLVTVKFDGNERTFENNIYEYTDNESNFKWDIGFDPIIGPYEGGTNITIQVQTSQKLKGPCYNITVAGVLCRPYEHECKIDQEIACKVDGIGRTESLTGPVIFNTENSSFISKENYSFVDPKIKSFSPKRGSISGGTILTFKGQHMNVGSSIEVFIDDLPCKVFANNSNEIKCSTSRSDKVFEGSVTVKFDGNDRTCKENSFAYMDTKRFQPSILFWPETGPYEGGTNITISCKYFDQNFDDMNWNITVAGVPCLPYKHLYILGKEIVCKVKGFTSVKTHSGPIILHVDNLTIESTQNYTFVDPKIVSFSPRRGPMYGATVITFKGQHLNAGRSIKIFMDDSPCVIFANNSNEIKCFTSPCVNCHTSSVIMQFDENNRTFMDYKYEYVNVNESEPDKNVLTVPRGIPQGGIIILMRGEHLESAENAQICVFNDDHTESFCGKCKFETNSLTCSSPAISEDNVDSIRNLREFDYSIKTNKTLKMPDVCIYKRYPKFVLYPNSIADILPEWQKINVNDYKQFNDEAGSKRDCTSSSASCFNSSLGFNSTKLVYVYECQEEETKQDENLISIISKNILTYAGILGVMVLTAIVFVFFIQNRKNQKKILKELHQVETMALCRKIKKIKINNPTDLDNNTLDILEQLSITIEYHNAPNTLDGAVSGEYEMPFDSRWEFKRTDLTLLKCLGQGEFGKVVKGKARGIQQKDVTTSVAVKMLKDTHSDSDMIDLVSEMEVMKVIGPHKNVLRLLGCCTQGGDLLIITEYASHGNLQMFLRHHHSSDVKTVATIVITERKLTDFAHQIAEGMEYLSSKRCIHRDLAARNVLVFKDYVMKIADFGLTRYIENKLYYRKKKGGRLPVKWMAPEALLYGVSKTQSDVWSYGILLWEIFTLGGMPYPSSSNTEDLFLCLRSGYRMEKPLGCSSKIYSLMRDCWSYEAEDRPSFTAIVQTLGKMLENNEVRSNLYWLNNKESDYEENEPCLLENFLLRRHVQNC